MDRLYNGLSPGSKRNLAIIGPWYAIPADDKSYMRKTVADIIVRTMQKMDLKYQTGGIEEKARFDEIYSKLKNEK